MSLLFHHPLIAFLLWTLLSVAFGLLLGKVIDHADAGEEPQTLDADTAVIDWNNRTEAWL